jgi:hypothetical protein
MAFHCIFYIAKKIKVKCYVREINVNIVVIRLRSLPILITFFRRSLTLNCLMKFCAMCRTQYTCLHERSCQPLSGFLYALFIDSCLSEIKHIPGWIWSATTYLICFEVVEIRQSDRVKLQFGFPQEIPRQPMDMQEYHKLSLRKVVDTSWERMWSNEIAD